MSGSARTRCIMDIIISVNVHFLTCYLMIYMKSAMHLSLQIV